MKRLQHHIAPPISFILTVQLAFCTVGCAGSDIDGSSTSSALAAKAASGFDGETLYRGLIFRSGPVAALIPEMWSLLGEQPRPKSEESIQTLRSSAETMLEAGNKDAAAALNKIADSAEQGLIPVGEPTAPTGEETIQATIEAINATDKTFFARFGASVQSGDAVQIDNAMTEASKLTMQVLSNRINSGAQELSVDVWYYWDIAVAIEVAAVAVIAVVIVFPAIARDDGLVHDQVVATIAKNLYVKQAAQ